MTAKRKTSERKTAIPNAEREWDIAEALNDDPLYREIMEELLHPKQLNNEEKLQSEIGDFLDSLCGRAFESEEAATFDKRWLRFLAHSIELAKRQFIKAGIPAKKAARFVVPGWACFDEPSADVRFRFGPPLDGSKAVQGILVFRDALWYPPTHVEAAVWRHPVIRAAAGKDEHLGWKNRVSQRLKWAESLSDHGASAQRLREISDAIRSMLHVSAQTEPDESAWITGAIQSERFWAILAHAVDFGIHQNARRLFMDGKLLAAAQRSVINYKAEHLSWWLIIEEAVRETFAATGSIPTPSELRKSFGVRDAPGSEQVVLEFADPRFRHHGSITWGPFKKYANQAGKIWSDDRTQ